MRKDAKNTLNRNRYFRKQMASLSGDVDADVSVCRLFNNQVKVEVKQMILNLHLSIDLWKWEGYKAEI